MYEEERLSTQHPIHRRYYAEDLARLRRASEGRRYAGSQRRGRIDPNPHQIDAVMFALQRIPDGGCILADEVGLGKTIEAGLVVAQLLAEGASRILIVVPRPLLGQWQDELFTLFGLEAREADDESVDVALPGVFLAGREYAGAARGFTKLSAVPPFDLCIIDEAHEVFAGIHRRFDRDGEYLEGSKHARTAHRVRKLIGPTPVLLMTATPIQNSLLELWGLLQYIEPTGTLLGSLPTFKELFCDAGEVRRLAIGQGTELRRRLDGVVQRTLRRQAQEFLDAYSGEADQLFRSKATTCSGQADHPFRDGDHLGSERSDAGVFQCNHEDRQVLLLLTEAHERAAPWRRTREGVRPRTAARSSSVSLSSAGRLRPARCGGLGGRDGRGSSPRWSGRRRCRATS